MSSHKGSGERVGDQPFRASLTNFGKQLLVMVFARYSPNSQTPNLVREVMNGEDSISTISDPELFGMHPEGVGGRKDPLIHRVGEAAWNIMTLPADLWRARPKDKK